MRGNQKLMKRKWKTMKRTPKMTTATRKSPGMATVRRRRDIFACCGIRSSIICRMTSDKNSAPTPSTSSPLPTPERLSGFAKKDKGGGIGLERGPGSLYKCRRSYFAVGDFFSIVWFFAVGKLSKPTLLDLALSFV